MDRAFGHHEHEAALRALAVAIVTNGLQISSVHNPEVLQFCAALRADFRPLSAYKLRCQLYLLFYQSAQLHH